MIKEEFVCKNSDCKRYDQSLAKYGEFKLIWKSGKGLVPENDKCPECGSTVELVQREVEGNIDVSFGRFASSGDEGKKRMILQRNKEVAKQDREMKEYYRNKQLKKMES